MKRLLLFLMCFTVSCSVGPNYKRPSASAPPAFKEQPPDGWKQAQPNDAFAKGKWWEIYNDPALNVLEEQVGISNQNVLQAEARLRQARAAIREARSALFPTVGGSVGITQSRAGISNGVNTSGARTTYSLPFDVSWEPDLWGSLRRGVTANTALAQASQAVLANTRLLFQAELAQDYFQLHGIDSEIDLLNRTVASYEEFLTLTRNRYAAGVVSDLDVAQAESQLYTTQSELIDLGQQRASLEHAIAILTGKAPADVSVAPALLQTPPPPVPVGVPSDLLERRPDIAASERNVAAANEEIGIALSTGDSVGHGRTSEFQFRKVVQPAEPVLVGGTAARPDPVRRGTATIDPCATAGRLRRDGGRLPPDRADCVRSSGRQSGGASDSRNGDG